MAKPRRDATGLRHLRATHSPQAIARRLGTSPRQSYVRDLVYGAIDGVVSTFAVVSGVAGAGLAPELVIVLGLANLVGDGFSMAVGNFLATRTEEHLLQTARAEEEDHVRLVPEGEREEVRQIFAAKGFAGTDLERAVDVITANRGTWINTMLTDELGLALHGPSPIRAALATFLAFITVGSVPLLSFVLDALLTGGVHLPFAWSAGLTGTAFFLVGALKSLLAKRPWYKEGATTLLVGSLAAAAAFGVGFLLRDVVA